jgi:hypothetical protein
MDPCSIPSAALDESCTGGGRGWWVNWGLRANNLNFAGLFARVGAGARLPRKYCCANACVPL